jgi:predicted MPP superfamily phosphohydrolase
VPVEPAGEGGEEQLEWEEVGHHGFERGLYEVGDTRAYVSRGISLEGGIMPRGRFWARPELTMIDLVGVGP